MLDLPVFSQYLDDTQAVDPLGTAPSVEALYRSIFPGINNAVEYIRVYSAICWMVRQIDIAAKGVKNPDIAAMSAAGLEKIQLLLTWYNVTVEVGGLAGADRTWPEDNSCVTLNFKSIPGTQTAKRLAVDPDYEVRDGGAHFLTAPQYRPSLVRGMRFLEEVPALPGTYRLSAAGEALADSYEEAIEHHERRGWLASVTQVTVRRDDVLQLGEMLDLRAPSGGEIAAFVSQFYPEDGEGVIGAQWQNRWAGLTLALRAIEVEQPQAREVGWRGVPLDTVRFTMARGFSLTGTPLNLDEIEEVQGWWANLQLRQYLRLAMETLGRYVQFWIHDAVVNEHPRDIVDCAQGLGALLEATLRAEGQYSSAGALAEQLLALKGEYRTFFEASPYVKELRLEGMITRLQAVCNFRPYSEEASLALREVYLALVYCAAEAGNLLMSPYVEQQFANDRISLATLRELLAKYRDERPAAFVAHIVQFYVILLHFAVVQERSNDGRNRFLFTLGDNGLERVTTKSNIGEVGLMPDRLYHSMLLLTQCGLVQRFDDDTYGLTKAGRKRLRGIEKAAQAA